MDINLVLLFALMIAIVVYFYIDYNERFSSSGLTMSNADCNKLSYVYYKTHPNQSVEDMRKGHHMICDVSRRAHIYPYTGNYYAVNGNLV